MSDPGLTTMEKADSLIEFPGNPRRGDVGTIRASLERRGQYKPIIVQLATRYVLAGNHTLKAARDIGWDEVEVRWVDCDDDEAKRILAIDNRSADLGEYDDRALAELLKSFGDDLEGTGYDGDYLSDLLEKMASEGLDRDGDDDYDGDDDGADADAGTLLALSDVSVAEPKHQPTMGSRWKLGDHLLVVARLSDEHFLWRDDLEGRIFAPYPEPYLTVSDIAGESRLLLVQPNRYLAGHLLDKHEAVFPGTVELLT